MDRSGNGSLWGKGQNSLCDREQNFEEQSTKF